MSEEAEHDPVEDALLRMGQFDAREAAIERAEAEGGVAEVPELSGAKMDAIVAASLRAAALEAEVQDATSSGSSPSWAPWVFGVAAAIAAALVLWAALPSQGQDGSAVGVGPLPPAQQLRLGGTARTLGNTPRLRAYGPGDAFFVELPFDAAVDPSVVAELFALDSEGARQPIPLPSQKHADAWVFEGEIAKLLSPGVWTLQVRYGRVHSCSAATPGGCETREARIKVVGP